MSPLGILNSAIKAVPAVRYALGIAGIVGAIAIVWGLKIDPRIAVFGTVIMFVLMTVLVVFAKAAGTSNATFAGPAKILTWFSLLLMMATATALFTGVFFRWPVNLQVLILRSGVGDVSSRDKAEAAREPSKTQPSPSPKAPMSTTLTIPSANGVPAHPQQWDKFVGVWESDELQDPLYTLPQQRCVQNLRKKFYLQVLETTPYRYIAKFSFQTIGSTHIQKDGELLYLPPCSSSIAPSHDGHDFPTSNVDLSGDVLRIEIDAWNQPLLLRFKRIDKDKLLALPGGSDTLLNNENRASLNGTGFQFYRR